VPLSDGSVDPATEAGLPEAGTPVGSDGSVRDPCDAASCTGSSTCGSAEGDRDDDGDGTANCLDGCPLDASKRSPGQCGCGVVELDGDADGTPDCVDECGSDPNKSLAGRCGCGVSEQDTDLDGMPDCIDRCSGGMDQYTPDQSCGVGYCRAHNTASSCVAGVETSCLPAAQLSQSDASCDGIDDDCDGLVDEDYVAPSVTTCGTGACLASGSTACVAGEVVVTCTPLPGGSSDGDCDLIDDDCDGQVDEEYNSAVSSCGTGACVAVGMMSCVEGTLVDGCLAKVATTSVDTSCNNVDDDCSGTVDEDYVVSDTNCGLGACARTGKLTCVRGAQVNSCVAGTPALTRDTSCNGIDDDCDGLVDEDFVITSTSCGVGYCASTGQLTCVAGATRNNCVVRAPRSATDDAFVPGNGVDDDCDGSVDEDVPACNTSTRTFEAGSYTVAVPGNCHSLTVRLWGGGGASGQNAGLIGGGGDGGPGGYVTATALVSGTINLYVGGGGAASCNNGGTNAGSASYNGGSGGTGAGADGADGVIAGGGAGASSGNGGGRGYYGGGGGGQGRGGLGASGNGGGGGAASVLLVNGTRAAVAGGGGGGGGAQALTLFGALASSGGVGGSGCGGNGDAPASTSGGGGGGGTCQGSTTQRGSGRTPANSGAIPNGRAAGADGSCAAGGNGFATITFAP
jgi:Putative metal-binding motif